MIEKYIKKKITQKDREKRMMERSLQGEYNKFTRQFIDSMYRLKVRKDSVARVASKKKADSIKKVTKPI